ncbi:MAG: thermonuclease family protein [Hyphomicrobiaceae bacterium]|jgi:micrococcal nuclease|nr:MAG: thermonuclease family protein [Hyphomicrobiaceae bacterium]
MKNFLKSLALAIGSLVSGPLSDFADAAAVRVIDGDTVVIERTVVRLEGIDTPETWRWRCSAEQVLGLKAKARLEVLLDGRDVTFVGGRRDRWGRTLGTVYADGEDVAERLIAEGLAIRWKSGPKAKAERLAIWCPAG